MLAELHAEHFTIVMHIVIEGRRLFGTVDDPCTAAPQPSGRTPDNQWPPDRQVSCYWPVHKELMDVGVKGQLTPKGRQHPPDLMAMGSMYGLVPLEHAANDLEIMNEAFLIAGRNSRFAAMDAILDAGLPVDYTTFGWPLIVFAAANRLLELTQYLIARGADIDRNWPPHATARSFMLEMNSKWRTQGVLAI